MKRGVVHIWQAHLADFFAEEASLFALLDTVEIARAKRFHFPLHRQRFIVAHGLLRRLIHRYTEMAPDAIRFHVGEKGKPSIVGDTSLQFNLSHSHDRALYAFTIEQEIGVDIEWMSVGDYKENLAHRYFSPAEIYELQHMHVAERSAAFYRLWTRKEAILKAMGTGLIVPLNIFSVSAALAEQTVAFEFNAQKLQFYLRHVPVDGNYQAALASSQKINEVITSPLVG